MSFQNRVALLRDMQTLMARHEFLKAGEEPGDQLEALRVEHEIAQLFLQWGLVDIQGLTVDGAPATVSTLLGSGPEELVREALGTIVGQIGLTEEERKN
jgi:hypothetical protein